MEDAADALSFALVVVEQRFEDTEAAVGSLFDGILEVIEDWVLLLKPNRVTFLVLGCFLVWHACQRLRAEWRGPGLAAAGVSLVAPVSWSLSAKARMALSGRNPEANIDSQEPELFNINKLRRPHPIYARAIDNRWRTWPPIPLGPTVLEYRNVRSFARRPDEKTWRQIVRLTEMPFEIFTPGRGGWDVP